MKYQIINESKLTYETALNRLQEITNLLEKNSVGLEGALGLYKEGSELTMYCNEQITKIEKEVKKIKVVNDNDEIHNETIE